MKYFLFLFIFSISLMAKEVSKESLRVRSVLGAAFCSKKPLKKGDTLKPDCKLSTHARSNVYLEIEKSKEVFSFGENSKGMILPQNIIRLDAGILRIKADKGYVIKTPQAHIDAKKGDYLIQTSPFLQETELISLEGSATLKSITDSSERALVSQNYWGGIGGRFGNKIGDLLSLSSEQNKVFKVILD